MNANTDPLIEMVNVHDLKLDPKNPRTMSTHDFETLKESLKSYGFVQPLVVNKRTMIICGGNQRSRAAVALGMTKVPVIWVDLDDKRAATLSIGLNKIAGEFDTDMLAELVLTLDEDLLSLTGFTDEELTNLSSDPFDDEKEPKPKMRKYSLEELRTLAKGIYPAEADRILDFLDVVERAS